MAAALPVLLRVLLLPLLPVPKPGVADEFSYLLAADTFAHGRIANPPHPLGPFFESFHILVRPTYASMYPPGQPLVMALTQVLLGNPWWGVVLSVGLMGGSVCWMLQAFLPRRWSLAGGLAFGLLYGIEHYFMNSYWGVPLAAAAGAVLAGALARIVLPRAGPERPVLLGALLGAGAGVLMHTRPWEGFWVALPAALLLAIWLVRSSFRSALRRLLLVALPALVPVALAAAALLAYNARVTGDPLESPYLLNLRQYYVAPLFVFQSERPAPAYTRESLRRYYIGWRESERTIRQDPGSRNPLAGLWIWFHDFKIVGAAVVAALFLVLFRRNSRTALLLLLLGGFLAGISLQTNRLFHYLAPGLGLLAAVLVLGLRTLSGLRFRGRRLGPHLAAVLVLAAATGFVRNTVLALRETQRGVGIRRAELVAKLNAVPGRHLVLVRYGPEHSVHHEWVYNGADIDGGRIVFAADLGPGENGKLFTYYGDRTVWRFAPDEGDAVAPVAVPAAPPP